MIFSFPEILTGLFCGVLFGYVLENAGFGSPCKLTAQFRLTDWSVFKVMFTAIVFTSVGLSLLATLKVIDMQLMFVPPAILGAAAIGGCLVGAGFAIGGYCPGTSVVGAVSGRIDAWVFLLGLLIGTVIYAGEFAVFEPLSNLADFAGGDTLGEALHVSDWTINAVMVFAAVMIFWVGGVFEAKVGGAITAEEAVEGACPASFK
jgi:uncharacterized protein